MKFILLTLMLFLNLKTWAVQNVSDMEMRSAFYFRGDVELIPLHGNPQVLSAEVLANKSSALVKGGEKSFFAISGKTLAPNRPGCMLERKVTSMIPKSSIRENPPGSLVWTIRLDKAKHQKLKALDPTGKTENHLWEDQFDISFVTHPDSPAMTLICRNACIEAKGLPKCEERIPTDTTELLSALGNGNWKDRLLKSNLAKQMPQPAVALTPQAAR